MKAHEHQVGGARPVPIWMVSFADLLSLLCTFFVMMLTFSTADRENFEKASGSLRGALGVTSPNVVGLSQSGMVEARYLRLGRMTTGMDFPPEFEPLAVEVSTINTRLKEERSGQIVQIMALHRGVLIRMPSNLLFSGDTAEFAPGSSSQLSRIADVICGLPNEVEIVSHLRTNYAGEQSPWDITEERAAQVAQFFHRSKDIEQARICVGGKGTSHPILRKPSEADDRVDITLLRPEK